MAWNVQMGAGTYRRELNIQGIDLTTFRTRSGQALSQLAEKPIGTDDTPSSVEFGSAAAACCRGAFVPQLLAAAGLDSDFKVARAVRPHEVGVRAIAHSATRRDAHELSKNRF